MSKLIEELQWRGLLQDATEGAAEHLAEASRTGYIGFDPSASSLHVGNLLVVMDLVQFHGHRAFADLQQADGAVARGLVVRQGGRHGIHV